MKVKMKWELTKFVYALHWAARNIVKHADKYGSYPDVSIETFEKKIIELAKAKSEKYQQKFRYDVYFAVVKNLYVIFDAFKMDKRGLTEALVSLDYQCKRLGSENSMNKEIARFEKRCAVAEILDRPGETKDYY